MNQGQEIVVPVKKDKHNFLNAFFLAKNGGVLLNVIGAKTGDDFNEFTGDGFMQPGGAITRHAGQNEYQAFIRANEAYDQTNDDYKRNDDIIFKFCMEYARLKKENYVFLIREKGATPFRFPTHPAGELFIPENTVRAVYIIFLEFEEAVDGVRYYNLVACFSGKRAPYCSKYLIKNDPSVREGCSLSEMSKQQDVINAIDAKIQEVTDSVNPQNLNANRLGLLNAFKTTVSVGLSPQQLDQANINAAVTQVAGLQTPSVSVASSDSSYTPSVNERVNNMFADLPSFTQTLVPGENVCADKMIIEMLKSNNKRPSLFSGGRRYKKTTQRNRAKQRNKTKRRHVYKNV